MKVKESGERVRGKRVRGGVPGDEREETGREGGGGKGKKGR